MIFSKPSELDALVYGHVEAILKSEQLIPDDTLLDKINSADQLSTHYNDTRNYLKAIASSSSKWQVWQEERNMQGKKWN